MQESMFMSLVTADPRERERPWLHHIRRMELAKAAELLKEAPGKRVLEIGGGDGFVAQELSNYGFDVTSIDLAPRQPASFPVQFGDATNLAFPDGSFDAIVTCHVLEEIPWPRVFAEMKRVLKPNGVAVHIVATTHWSALTATWHFLTLPAFVAKSVGKRMGKSQGNQNGASPKTADANTAAAREIAEQWTTSRRLKWALLHPVGYYPSFVHEIFLFSNPAWSSLFRRNGFSVAVSARGPVLASGLRVFPFKAMATRQGLAKAFPSSRIYLTRPS